MPFSARKIVPARPPKTIANFEEVKL